MTRQAAGQTGLRAGIPVVCGGGDVLVSAVGGGALATDTVVYIAGSTDSAALPMERPSTDGRWANSAYVPPDDPLFEVPDDQLRADFLQALGGMYPRFRNEDVLAFRVSRVKHVLPIPTLRYSELLPPITTSVPGVHIVNSVYIVNGTLNVNETIELAERAVAGLSGDGLALARSQDSDGEM